MHPPPELKRRIQARIRQLPSPTRGEGTARSRVLINAGLIAPLFSFIALGGIRAESRPTSLIVETALGAALLAVSSVWIVLGGGRMLGRSRLVLVSMVGFWPISLLVWKLGWSTLASPGALVPWPTRPGFACFGFTLLLGLMPLAALVWLRRRSDPTHPASLGAALGVAAGSYAALLVDLWCPVGYPWHVLLAHVLPVLLLGLFGALVGHFALALRDDE